MIAMSENSLSIEAHCEALDVSPSGYYAWRKREASARQRDDETLGDAIEDIFQASRETYGSGRVYQALKREGIRTSTKRVARLMRERGLRSVRSRQRRPSLTCSQQNSYVAANHLAQDFVAQSADEKWVADTTYIPTQEGWLYLVSIVDLYNKRVVGWAMGQHHDAALATAALQMAVQHHRPAAGLILHTDRGTEFANATFTATAHQAGIRLSMSSTGNCYDNAPAESFFATVKLEAVNQQVYPSHATARQALFDYIEVFYNRQRLHSALGFRSPEEFCNAEALLLQ